MQKANTAPCETVEKSYTLRRLQANDLFLVAEIIRKIGVGEFAECLSTPRVRTLVKQMSDKKEDKGGDFIIGIGVMMEIADKVMKHLPDCETEIYKLLGSLSGIEVSDLEAMDAPVFVDMLTDVIVKEEFRDFSKVASKFVKAGD